MAVVKQQAGTIEAGPRPASLKAFALAAVLVTIAAAAILIGSLVVGSLAGSVSGVTGAATDTSYDQIERMRIMRDVSAGSVDGSYDQVEQLRGAWTGH
jgi:hypothetical protein